MINLGEYDFGKVFKERRLTKLKHVEVNVAQREKSIVFVILNGFFDADFVDKIVEFSEKSLEAPNTIY